MKKNLFLLFALICSTSLFTACSDDDEDTGWQEIPKEIPAENVKLDVNGTTPAGATATLEVKTAETGVLTLDKVVYGHASIPVNVTLTKVAEGSYDFVGTANIDGKTKAALQTGTDLGLTVSVKGNVTKAGELTVSVTTSGWGTLSGVYSGDSLKVTINGKDNGKYPVTLTATSETKATLVFKKIANVANDFTAEVTLTKEGEGYKITGSTEKEAGYTVSISGTLAKNVLTLNVTTSGYATLNGTYSVPQMQLSYNGVAAGENSASSASIAFTSATTINLTLGTIVPGIFIKSGEDGSTDIIAKNVKVEKATDSETYSFSGSTSPEGFSASTVTFSGSISPERVLTLSVNHTIKSNIVGKWNMAKNGNSGKVFFDFQSAKNTVKIPDALYPMIPPAMGIPATMNDANFIGLMSQLLGQYTNYLKSIEFAATGDIVVTYSKMGEETTGKEYTLTGYMNYVITDKGKLAITPNLGKLLGMLMPANKGLKAYDPYDPTYILMGEGIPLNYSVIGSELEVTIDNGVFIGLGGFVEGLLPLIGMFLPDPALAEQINAIFVPIYEIIKTSPKLEVGLFLNK